MERQDGLHSYIASPLTTKSRFNDEIELMRGWCRETLPENSWATSAWYNYDILISFKNAQDALMFYMRWK